MGEVQGLYALWLREVKVFLRERSRVVSAIATPILFLLVLGAGYGATTEFVDPRYAAFGYQRFLFPGIIGMAVLFGTVFFGMNIIWDKRLDVLKEVLVAPVSRTTIFFGKVLGGGTEAMAQAVLLTIIGVAAFGARPEGAPAALLFSALMAIFFVSVGLFVGSFFTSYEGFGLVMSFLVFPAFILSGALYPIEGLPDWLLLLTRLNPAAYAVDGIRGSLLGPHALPYAVDAGALVACDLLALAAGTWAFRRMR